MLANTVAYNPDCFGGELLLNSDGEIQQAQAMKARWFLKKPAACVKDNKCASLDFMKEYISEMEKLAKARASDVTITYLTSRSLDDELGKAIGADMPLVGAAYLIMVIVCCCSLGKGVRHGLGRSSAALAGGGVLCVLLSTIAGYGIAGLCGAW